LFRVTTALSLAAAAVGEGVCNGDSCREAPVDLLQNQVKVQNQKSRQPANACFLTGDGDGDIKDATDRTHGCAKDMHKVFYHTNAEARDEAAASAQAGTDNPLTGKEYWSQDRCFNMAARDANCGGNVLYHEGGIRCYCVKDADAHCKPKHMPTYKVAECTCKLHAGMTCDRANSMDVPRIDRSCSAHDCLAACIAEGNQTGCCQWNSKSRSCKLWQGGCADDWTQCSVVEAGNENKHIMLLDECFGTA